MTNKFVCKNTLVFNEYLWGKERTIRRAKGEIDVIGKIYNLTMQHLKIIMMSLCFDNE